MRRAKSTFRKLLLKSQEGASARPGADAKTQESYSGGLYVNGAYTSRGSLDYARDDEFMLA